MKHINKFGFSINNGNVENPVDVKAICEFIYKGYLVILTPDGNGDTIMVYGILEYGTEGCSCEFKTVQEAIERINVMCR